MLGLLVGAREFSAALVVIVLILTVNLMLRPVAAWIDRHRARRKPEDQPPHRIVAGDERRHRLECALNHQIVGVEIPTGNPLEIDLDSGLKPTGARYLDADRATALPGLPA
jgi:uncharacterized membrane protein YhiD involved in acid resistance